jgi:hypothetical protein
MARLVKVGSVFKVPVKKEHIDKSVPCDKGHCMLTIAAIAFFVAHFGDRDFRVRSTNHGLQFDLNGYRILCVFDHQTGHRIYKYDEVYKRTRSMERARASVKPFTAKLMIESCQRIPAYPPMSEETKALLAEKALERKTPRATGIKASNRRQLSE